MKSSWKTFIGVDFEWWDKKRIGIFIFSCFFSSGGKWNEIQSFKMWKKRVEFLASSAIQYLKIFREMNSLVENFPRVWKMEKNRVRNCTSEDKRNSFLICLTQAFWIFFSFWWNCFISFPYRSDKVYFLKLFSWEIWPGEKVPENKAKRY